MHQRREVTTKAAKTDDSLKARIRSALGAILKPFYVPEIDEDKLSKVSGYEEAEIRRADFCARVSRRAASIISLAFVLAIFGFGIPDEFRGWTILACVGLVAAMAITAIAVSKRSLPKQGGKFVDDEPNSAECNDGHRD